MTGRLCETTRKLRFELTNAKEMETQNEWVIYRLQRELEKEQRARAEDATKAKQ